MEVVRSNFFTKSNHTLNTVVRNSSCSRGWLRLVVQSIFGTITVSSFVLIVIMAMSRSTPQRYCAASNCRVVCSSALFNEAYEWDVVSTVLETGLSCENILLALHNIKFYNETLPVNWLSRLPPKIVSLHLLGSNLLRIPPNAFLGPWAGSLRELVLVQITIECWTPDTLVGLNNLRMLNIKDSALLNIRRHALRAVDETLEVISMTSSGKWNLGYVTGTPHLENVHRVYLSENDFGSTIRANTFSGIKSCRVLFLNSCRITSIAAGSFDSLKHIEMLFLNDNYLSYIAPGLFTTIMNIENPKPRIHLQDNLWKCDCSQKDLMLLSKNDLLLVDPVCYQPDHMHGEVISKLEEYCNEIEEDVTVIDVGKGSQSHSNTPFDVFNKPCFFGTKLVPNTSLRVISPVSQFVCPVTHIKYFEKILRSNNDIANTDHSWLEPTFLMQNNLYTVMQVGSSAVNGMGLIWYQSTCPNEAYCVNSMPNFLRVYNVMLDTEYTFCPINLSKSAIEIDDCIRFNTTHYNNQMKVYWRESPVLYVTTAFLCILFGALLVYAIIRKNPSLLKGSKRLLFVKHRGVDALVLPPKIPLRSSLTSEESIKFNGKRIFTISDVKEGHFYRSLSVRSDKSTTPTYISAMQPTEDQLAEWRIRNHFNQNDSIVSISSDMSKYSWLCEDCSENSSNFAYESLK